MMIRSEFKALEVGDLISCNQNLYDGGIPQSYGVVIKVTHHRHEYKNLDREPHEFTLIKVKWQLGEIKNYTCDYTSRVGLVLECKVSGGPYAS
jgi:hypothetical protein